MRRFYKLTGIILLSAAAGIYVGYVGSDGQQGCVATSQQKKLKFSGTFIQLLPESHANWTATRWSMLFTHLKALGIQKLIIQWSAYNTDAGFPFSQGQPAIQPELKTIIDLADQFKMTLYLGLNYDPAYWKKVEQDMPSVKAYLHGLREKNMQLAQSLIPALHNRPSFAGWYITEEIDDINWNDAEKRVVIMEYLQSLSDALRQLTPGKAVAISGFSNAALSPAELTEFWSQILAKTAIDEVLFQDGIGVNKLNLELLADYLDAVMWATVLARKQYHVVVEVFQQVAGAPLDERPFKAISAAKERVQKQVEIASIYAPEIFAFGIPEYMTPDSGELAECLYEHFKTQNTSK